MAAKRPPNSSETLPDGTLVEFWDEIGVDDAPQRRRYAVNGKRSTSISSVAKALDTDPSGLMYWAANLTCEGVAEMFRDTPNPAWLGSGKSIAFTLRENALTWKDVRDKTARRGTAVHERILAALAAGEGVPSLSDLDESERAYGQAAMRWWRDRKPEPIAAEQMTADPSVAIAGRFDLLADIDGCRVLVDAKTREKGRARVGDHVQLAGYERCNLACGFGPSDSRLALLLLPDGTYREVWGQGTLEDFDVALTALRAGRQLEARMRKAEQAANTRHETDQQITAMTEAMA